MKKYGLLCHSLNELGIEEVKVPISFMLELTKFSLNALCSSCRYLFLLSDVLAESIQYSVVINICYVKCNIHFEFFSNLPFQNLTIVNDYNHFVIVAIGCHPSQVRTPPNVIKNCEATEGPSCKMECAEGYRLYDNLDSTEETLTCVGGKFQEEPKCVEFSKFYFFYHFLNIKYIIDRMVI